MVEIYLSQFNPVTVQRATGCRSARRNPWSTHQVPAAGHDPVVKIRSTRHTAASTAPRWISSKVFAVCCCCVCGHNCDAIRRFASLSSVSSVIKRFPRSVFTIQCGFISRLKFTNDRQRRDFALHRTQAAHRWRSKARIIRWIWRGKIVRLDLKTPEARRNEEDEQIHVSELQKRRWVCIFLRRRQINRQRVNKPRQTCHACTYSSRERSWFLFIVRALFAHVIATRIRF